MNPDILGYIAYVLIVAFSWLQLFFSFRGRTINLGAWPLVSLTAGLAALQVALFLGPATPLYLLVGNGLSFLGTAVNLLRVTIFKPRPTTRVGGTLEKYAEKMLKLALPLSAFRRKPEPIAFESVNFCKEEPDYLTRRDFEPCKGCGALVFSYPDNAVEVAVYDIALAVAREGRNLPPYDNLVHVVRHDFFCKLHRPAYDRKVYTPQISGETVVEYFRLVHGGDGMTPNSYRQVTEDGEQYD